MKKKKKNQIESEITNIIIKINNKELNKIQYLKLNAWDPAEWKWTEKRTQVERSLRRERDR